MNDIHIYHFYKSIYVRIARLIICSLLLGTIVAGIYNAFSVRVPLVLLSGFLMSEIFFHFTYMRRNPTLSVMNNAGASIYDSFTSSALDLILFTKTPAMIHHLLHTKAIAFVLQKADIAPQEIPLLDISKEEIAQLSFQIAKNNTVLFVTTIDIFAAYIILIESQTRILFKKELKDDDFFHIIYWAHVTFPNEEICPKVEAQFTGEGIAESWVSGWTYETQKYITNLSEKVVREKPVLLGRKKEFGQLVDSLSKEANNSVLLVGEPGAGKTALYEALALQSKQGKLPGSLYHERILQLEGGALLAGVEGTGQVENRLETILQEVSHAQNVILVISEIQNILGAATFHSNLSAALMPYVKSGKLRIIATTTIGAYKTFIQPQQSFADLFEVIHVNEPERGEIVQILLEKAGELASRHAISLTYKAVIACVDLATHYMPDHILPGAAVSLMQYVASGSQSARHGVITDADVVAKVEEKAGVSIATPKESEKDLLLHLEEKLHERVIGQDIAVAVVSQAMRRFRSNLRDSKRPISFLFLGPTGVGKTEMAKALASLYFGGEEKMIRLDMSEYAESFSVERLLGGTNNQQGELTEKIREHPFSVVLLDEFEKAHPDILNLFLQVLEDGRLTNTQGQTVSFSDAIIIATSNAGSEFIREQIQQGVPHDSLFQQKLLGLLQEKAIFKPELLNRFDDIVAFTPLTEEELTKIIRILLSSLAKNLLEKDIVVSFDETIIQKIIKEGIDIQFGARPLRRYIQNTIEDLLAKALLGGTIQRGATIKVSVDATNMIRIM